MSQITDSELLELAAKAAGTDVLRGYFGAGECWLTGKGDYGLMPWKPLEDDGDALRLAKKLFLSIDVGFGCCQIVVSRKGYGIGPALEVVVNGDLPGATLSDEAYRRAIVRAAAEIGSAMP